MLEKPTVEVSQVRRDFFLNHRTKMCLISGRLTCGNPIVGLNPSSTETQ